jgi:hypothetical protein
MPSKSAIVAVARGAAFVAMMPPRSRHLAICPGSINVVALEASHWQSLCPIDTIRPAFGSDEVLRVTG